jgi:hypothetical protein
MPHVAEFCNTLQDFIYLDVNPAFERLSGLKDVIGKKRSEVSPDLHQSTPELFDIYLRVASSGKTEALEYYVETRKTWIAVSMYCPNPAISSSCLTSSPIRNRQKLRCAKADRNITCFSRRAWMEYC